MLLTKKGPLFRTMQCLAKEVDAAAGGYGMSRGVATLVSKVLNRPKMDLKDIGRRAVITKLVHAGLPNADVEKYISVHEKTIAIYHRAHNSLAIKAAAVLSAYGDRQPATMASIDQPATSHSASAVAGQAAASSRLHLPSASVQPHLDAIKQPQF